MSREDNSNRGDCRIQSLRHPPYYGLRVLLMRILKIIRIVVAVFILVVIGVVARFWWATLTPRVPKGWPVGSVWVEAPPEVLDWSPRGEFVGCWLDAGRDVDRCQFANYQGKISYVGDYTTCDGRGSLSDAQLKVHLADYTKEGGDESLQDRVILQDETILIPVSACKAHFKFKGR